MIIYPATFEEGSQYHIVKFPDIPEAMTQGETLEETYEMAVEVLGAVLEDYETLPTPTPIADIQKEFPDKSVALIGLDLLEFKRKHNSKTIRKNVTIPEWLNDLATSEQINFSQTLTEALEEKLGV